MLSKVRDVNPPDKVNYADFASGKSHTIFSQYDGCLAALRTEIKALPDSTYERFALVQKLEKLMLPLEQAHTGRQFLKVEEILLQFASHLADVPETGAKVSTDYSIPNIPDPIRPEILADLAELEKCFVADCLRSCVIICGRLLETALHRKYFETTGQDILEKNPGIGLGTLVAKLTEKGILIDPGLTNMIHLINNVRIFTVHKKKEAFYPTKDQTQATILFTLDVIRKLFGR